MNNTERSFNENQEQFKTSGNILFVTEKESDRFNSEAQLVNWISTDGIIPSVWCMRYSDPKNLGRYLLTGSGFNPGEVQGSDCEVLVLGESSGRGSSREQAQLALKGAGIKLVIGDDLAKIFSDNCHNYGIHTLSLKKANELGFFEKKSILLNEIIDQYDPITRDIIKYGGLISYTKARLEGLVDIPSPKSEQIQPLSVVEKIIAKNTKIPGGHTGVLTIKPGDTVFVKVDKKYAYELQTNISQQILEETFGDEAPINPKNVWLFEDHLALMATDNPVTVKRRNEQREFAQNNKIFEYRAEDDGVEGICHTVMLEKHVFPGDLVLGNDSHTCHLGAGNALALGKGASDFAASLLTEDTPVTVPETIKVDLKGKFRPGVFSKDLMLYLISKPEFKNYLIASGTVLQFGGEALEEMEFDDQQVLTNMAIEGQAYTGIVEPNKKLVEFMMDKHSLDRENVEKMLVYPDKNAQYKQVFEIDLSGVERMVALPGDTQNAVPLKEVKGTKAQFFYIGSCAGGKLKDLREVAAILKGRRIALGVEMQIQASSKFVREQAGKEGLLKIFEEAGAKVILQGCGHCMGATEDANDRVEVVLSDTDRSFSGRMGKNRRAYLANPEVIAASAVMGEICAPEDL